MNQMDQPVKYSSDDVRSEGERVLNGRLEVLW